MINITKIAVGAFEVNCYIVSINRQALIVDPGADADKIAKAVKSRRLNVKAYLITHGHTDHISALAALRNEWPAPIAMHGADLRWAFGPANQLPPYYSSPLRPAAIERVLKGGELFEGRVGQPCPTEPNGGTGCPALPEMSSAVGSASGKSPCLNKDDFNYQVIHTPGHSPGGVCFYFPGDNLLFSGDTLFQGTVGRTDLPGGNMAQLNKSLKILAALPPATKVYPGHGPETTMELEMNSNPFLRSK